MVSIGSKESLCQYSHHIFGYLMERMQFPCFWQEMSLGLTLKSLLDAAEDCFQQASVVLEWERCFS